MAEIYLDDNLIRSLGLKPQFANVFPFFGSMTIPVNTGCGSCGRKKELKVPDFQGIKRAIAGLPAEEKRKLKSMMSVTKITMKYRDISGQWIKLVF